MEHDGFSLDDKRQRVAENDIPDLLACWQHRHDAKFQKKRDARLAELQREIAPLKADRLQHHATIHRLKFEEVVAESRHHNVAVIAPRDEPSASDAKSKQAHHAERDGHTARIAREQAEAELAELQSRIVPLEQEINQLTRQFWVNKEQVVAQKYDLPASRYRQVEHEEVFYEQPAITLERMQQLENVAGTELRSLLSSLPGGKQP